MGTQEVLMDYGERQLPIKVPADAQLVIRKDPPALANPQGEFERAIRQPLGLPPITEFVGKGSRVTIAFDAPPRSGIPRRLAIAAILKELEKCGLTDRDVTLICAAGSQRKRTVTELCNNLGPEIFNRFWPHRLLNHDCTKDLVNLGTTELGDTVEYNSAVAQSDGRRHRPSQRSLH
jgi:nickel-dependent lactate racemase